jgi:antitoxin component of RelBE/YafQ-DinJ toxin-antitoxin module
MANGNGKKRRKVRSERKENVVVVRVTEDQKRRYALAATEAGLDVSTWLRFLAEREAKEKGHGP